VCIKQREKRKNKGNFCVHKKFPYKKRVLVEENDLKNMVVLPQTGFKYFSELLLRLKIVVSLVSSFNPFLIPLKKVVKKVGRFYVVVFFLSLSTFPEITFKVPNFAQSNFSL